MSSAESQLGLLHSIFPSAERLCESKHSHNLFGAQRKVSAIFITVGSPYEWVFELFFAARNTTA